jgi:ATP-dependent Clp protease ATP-binding subunit ClpA
MTSNLGAREMAEVTEGKMGFSRRFESAPELDARIEKIGVEAARRKFSPEFMNRLDKVVVFRSLTQESLRRILDIEFQIVQRRVLLSGSGNFVLSCADRAKDFLLAEGFDQRYGTRPLKRAIERYLVTPLSNLIATKQIEIGDLVCVDVDEEKRELCFKKKPCTAAMEWAQSMLRGPIQPLAA